MSLIIATECRDGILFASDGLVEVVHENGKHKEWVKEAQKMFNLRMPKNTCAAIGLVGNKMDSESICPVQYLMSFGDNLIAGHAIKLKM